MTGFQGRWWRRWTAHVLACVVLVQGATAAGGAPREPAELFQHDKVWTAHLRFTAEDWAAMQTTHGGSFFPLLAGNRKDAALSGPAAALAWGMLHRGDRDGDGKLSRAEALSLAQAWHARLAPKGAGPIDGERLRTGLDALLDPEGVTQAGTFPITLRGGPGKRNGLATAMGIQFNSVRVAMEFEGVSLDAVSVRYKGNGTFHDSRGTLKRPLKADLNDFAKGQKLAGVSKLNFHNNVTDAGMMNESVAYRMYRDAGVPAPRTAYVKVYVTAPKAHERKYFGLYSLAENVDEDFAKDRFGTKKGAIFKPVTPSLFADMGEQWADYERVYDPKTEVSREQAARVMEMCRLVTHADDAELAAKLGDFIDLDAMARYLAVTAYIANVDSILYIGQNYYLYLHPGTNKFHFIPWDVDHAFGTLMGGQEQMAELSVQRPWGGPNRFLERVFKVEAFKKLYLARMEEFSGSVFKPQRIHAQVDELAKAIRPAVAEESKQKLAAFEKSAAGGSVKQKPGFFAPRPVVSIKGFVDARTPSVLEQLAGKKPGGPVPTFGGRPGQSPGKALALVIIAEMDGDGDAKLTRDELSRGFGRWLEAWDAGGSGALTQEQIRVAVGKHLSPATRPAGNPGRRPETSPAK
jgi:spore coat protein CotH